MEGELWKAVAIVSNNTSLIHLFEDAAQSNYSRTTFAAASEDPDISSSSTVDEEFLSSLSVFFTFLMVLMCFAGSLMNSLSLVIFTRPAFRRRSINVLLAGLSASDLCLCLLAIPVFSLNQLHKILPEFSYRITSRILVYAYPVTLMAQTMSVWMLVSITVDRYLAVCHPFAVRIYCTTTRALITTFTIVLFSVGYNFVRFWEYTINDDEEDIPVNNVGMNDVIVILLNLEEARIVGLLRENHLYMLLYQNIALLLTQFVLPLLVLGVLNLQVAKAILEADETRRVLVASERREHVTAKMMLFVVIVFIFCYVLSLCLNLLEIFNPDLFKHPIGFLLNDVNNVLVVINSSSSFIFYTKYSSRYRAQLRSMQHSVCRLSWWLFFCCCCIDEAGDYYADGQQRRSACYAQKQIKSYSEVSGTFVTDNNEYRNPASLQSKKGSMSIAPMSNGTSRKVSSSNFVTSENGTYGAATMAAAKQMLQYNKTAARPPEQPLLQLHHCRHSAGRRSKSLFMEFEDSKTRRESSICKNSENWA